MHVRKLPPLLIKRLKKDAKNPLFEKWFEKMKSLDKRLELTGKTFASNVRELDVSKNFPGTRLAIKRIREGTAEEAINRVKEAVRHHNLSAPKRYFLAEPIAYPISEKFVAMNAANAVSIFEIVHKTSKRGIIASKRLEEHGISVQQLKLFGRQVYSRTGISEWSLLLVGFKKGKPVLVPPVS